MSNFFSPSKCTYKNVMQGCKYHDITFLTPRNKKLYLYQDFVCTMYQVCTTPVRDFVQLHDALIYTASPFPGTVQRRPV